jgi:sirohydrochlorin ferrochelatase
VQLLAATVQDLRARGTRVIVVLAPLHLQALQSTGAFVQRDVPGALARIRDAVRAHGGTVVDLSPALPSETYFTDAYTHFSAAGNHLIAGAMLADLARVLADDR